VDKIVILYFCGIYNVILVIFHFLFWNFFNWKITLKKGTKANALAIQIMNIQLIYLFLFMAIIFFVYPKELLNSVIGQVLLIGYAGFWILRFGQQFVFIKEKNSFVIKLHILFFIGAILHLLAILV